MLLFHFRQATQQGVPQHSTSTISHTLQFPSFVTARRIKMLFSTSTPPVDVVVIYLNGRSSSALLSSASGSTNSRPGLAVSVDVHVLDPSGTFEAAAILNNNCNDEDSKTARGFLAARTTVQGPPTIE